ncbi:MAG: peptide chain release factor 1 [Dehalococcoidia bacterium SM23_28_1]|nr:MAG: peptide chain release factor 1 [Dehalococcoidia bacterium SM23_28_1]
MWDKLASIEKRYEELAQEMARPEVAADFQQLQTLAKEHASLEGIVSLYREYKRVDTALAEARSLAEDSPDRELAAMARDEAAQLGQQRQRLEDEIRLALLPKDPYDERPVIMEIRAAAGGGEAALFAADLFRMYSRYAERQGWPTEVMSSHPSDLGGFKEIIYEVRGRGAYSRLKYEGGAHRVQRIPITEASGRIHTSTATVAVLPEADEVDLKIDEDDLRIDIFRAGGHGGQNVNKLSTAVRITHIPSGMTAVCQDERSQLKNKLKALTVLRARLLDVEQKRQHQEISEARRAQVGSGERAEKVRTYNFPQDRVTDHRVGLTVHSLPAILDGDLDEIIDALATEEQAKRLQETLA